MAVKDVSFKMFVENNTFKRAEVIESILNSLARDSEDIDLRITDVPSLKYDGFEYYLLSFQTLARSKQEYLVEQSFENVYGMFLICEDKNTRRRGLVYVTDNGSEIVLDLLYDDIGKVGNKIFQGFDKEGNCIAQVYDNSYDFVDFTEMYVHDILNFAGFKFYLMNNSEVSIENSEFLYVEVMGVDEVSNDFTENIEDVFILRGRDEFSRFFDELMEELKDLYSQEEYQDLVDIKNDLCSHFKM